MGKMKKSTIRIAIRKADQSRLVMQEPASPEGGGDGEELVAPDEWEALVKGAEAEAATPRGARSADADLSAEDIWKRLSSTRWLKDAPSGEGRQSSTA